MMVAQYFNFQQLILKENCLFKMELLQIETLKYRDGLTF